MAAGSLFAATLASAEVSWSIGIGGPAYYESAPVYTAPPTGYQQPPPRVFYRPPPSEYYHPPSAYYEPPPQVYYRPTYRSGHHHHGRRDWDNNDRQD